MEEVNLGRVIPIPTVDHKWLLPSALIGGPLHITKIEVTNFMLFEKNTFEFFSKNFIMGNASSGKSAIIIAIFVALGQDDILPFYGYNRLIDLIKIGSGIATLKLTLKTEAFSKVAKLYGPTVQIIRKIQRQDGEVIKPVWRIKNPLASNSIVMSNDEIFEIFSQLSLPKWDMAVPYIITYEILRNLFFKNDFKFWYQQFERLLEARMSAYHSRKNHVNTEIEQLKKSKQDLQTLLTENAGAFTQCEEESIIEKAEKFELQLQTKIVENEELASKMKRKREECIEEFESFYKQCCIDMGITSVHHSELTFLGPERTSKTFFLLFLGFCVIESELQEIHFLVEEVPVIFNRKLIPRQFGRSSLRSKLIAITVLVFSFWKTMDISKIYVVEQKFESQHLERFFQSQAFADLLASKKNHQFFLTGYKNRVLRSYVKTESLS